jgi:hypothetical protein
MAFDGGPSDFWLNFNKWKERNFPPGSSAEETFEYLCVKGCDPGDLQAFLTSVVKLSQTRHSVADTYRVSRSALVKLPERLEKVSRELDAINLLLRDYRPVAVNPNRSDEVPNPFPQIATVYLRTPKLLQALARDLRVANAKLSKFVSPKRWDDYRHFVLLFLEYVEHCTKSPRYQQVADLINHVSSAEQKTLQNVAERLPKRTRAGARKKNDAEKPLTSPDALKALYHRAAKYDIISTLFPFLQCVAQTKLDGRNPSGPSFVPRGHFRPMYRDEIDG